MNKGIAFEKLVANIQAQIDPTANVTHNQKLTDRHGHKRQFDVVIRGHFAGQEILGVIECKELNKKVGTPEVDAFVTKSLDINANFKIIVSKRGFSKQAIEKARHYGVQTFSLIPNDETNTNFKVGNYWFADIYFWDQMSVRLLYVAEPNYPVSLNPRDIKIDGKRVVDWFANYLIAEHDAETELGWVAGVEINFDEPQMVSVNEKDSFACRGIEFHAKRGLLKKQKFVGLNGTGFFDWQKNKATLPPQENIRTDAVQTNFMEWDDRGSDEFIDSGFLNVRVIGHSAQFSKVEDAIVLEKL